MTLEESREGHSHDGDNDKTRSRNSRILWQRWYRNCRNGTGSSCLSGAEPEFKKLQQRISRLLNLLPDTEEAALTDRSNRKPESNSWKTRISNGRN